MALAISSSVPQMIDDTPSNAEGKLPNGLIRTALTIDTVGAILATFPFSRERLYQLVYNPSRENGKLAQKGSKID